MPTDIPIKSIHPARATHRAAQGKLLYTQKALETCIMLKASLATGTIQDWQDIKGGLDLPWVPPHPRDVSSGTSEIRIPSIPWVLFSLGC